MASMMVGPLKAELVIGLAGDEIPRGEASDEPGLRVPGDGEHAVLETHDDGVRIYMTWKAAHALKMRGQIKGSLHEALHLMDGTLARRH